jgi:hypothetical protein
MRVGIVGAVQIKWGALTLAAETSSGTKTSNVMLKILVSMSRSWSMLTPAVMRWHTAGRAQNKTNKGGRRCKGARRVRVRF